MCRTRRRSVPSMARFAGAPIWAAAGLGCLCCLLAAGAAKADGAEPEEASAFARPGTYLGFTGFLPMFYETEKFGSASMSLGGALVIGHRFRPSIGLEVVTEGAVGVLSDNQVAWFLTAGPKFYFATEELQPYLVLGLGAGACCANEGAYAWPAARTAVGLEAYLRESLALVLEGAVTAQLFGEEYFVQVAPRVGLLYRF